MIYARTRRGGSSLAYLQDDDAEVVDRLFAKRRDARIAAATERLAGKTDLGARASTLAEILDEDGYLATCEPGPDGAWRIVEHNCAIADVARRHGQACSSELAFIRAVLPDVHVERVSHLLDGARHCAYELR